MFRYFLLKVMKVLRMGQCKLVEELNAMVLLS